jgi:ABC-2 type transport system permease protein
VNWHHLRTFLWLKWRLRINQMRRAGTGSVIIQRIVFAFLIGAAVMAFIVALVVGISGLSPPVVMLVWDGMVVGYVIFWMTELLVELQRSELLSLDRFLHLPVSLTGVFLINYIGSIFSPSTVVFLSAAVGFSIGLVVSNGFTMLLLFPLLAGFTVAVTAITYQFRGWLASLMVNKRRRRTIITLATFAFILFFQIPNFMNMAAGGWGSGGRRQSEALRRETAQLEVRLAKGEINKADYEREVDAIYEKYGRQRRASRSAAFEEMTHTATTINKIVPLGWLPYGARASAEGNAWPPLLGALGLALVGTVSLRRSLTTTLRLYTGQFTGRVRAMPAESTPVATEVVRSTAQTKASLLERRLPWMSEQASVIALAAFRSMLRAPETKIMLLSPLILVGVFGSMFVSGRASMSEYMRPLMVSGAMAMVLITMLQLAGNQFGFDRSGFRTYVLAPASRADILLGKNIALLPLAVGLGSFVVIVVQVFAPMRIDHFVAALIQLVSMYFLFCVATNFLSIFAATPVASGSLKPVKPAGMTILIHLMFFFLLPLALSPTLIPLGIEFFLQWSGWSSWFPAYLVFAVVELVAIGYLYPLVLRGQGRILQAREQRILEIVTAKVE